MDLLRRWTDSVSRGLGQRELYSALAGDEICVMKNVMNVHVADASRLELALLPIHGLRRSVDCCCYPSHALA
jgi:hypothetical protein